MANDSTENLENQTLKPLAFDNNAKKFLSNKLVKEICRIDESFKEAETFMLDQSISGKEMAEYLSKEGNAQKLRDALDRFTPVINCQIKDLIKDKNNAGLGTEDLLKKFKNKLNDSFKCVDFSNRPLLKMVVDELVFLIELSVVNSRKGINKENNIESSGEFAKDLVADKSLSGLYGLKFAVYATKLHKIITAQVLPPIDEEINLTLKDTDITITISKNGDHKAFEFADVKVTKGEKSFMTTISLLNAQLNCKGSKLVSMKNIFSELKADAHYEYLRFKIFEAIEDALLEDKFEKKTVEDVKEAVKEEIQEVVEPILPAPEEAAEPTLTKPKKKQMEGSKQFNNIRMEAVAKAITSFDGVEEVDPWNHNACRTFTRMVDGELKTVNIMPHRDNTSMVNPHYVKAALDRFKIDYEEFKDKL